MPQLEHITAIEKRLWNAADQLRANSTYASNEYLLPVMGLVFLRHAHSRYLNVKVEIVAGLPTRGGNTPRSFVYWTFSNEASQREFENLAYGVAQLNLSPLKLAEREFIKPSVTLITLFDEVAEPILRQLCKLNLQNVQLAEARDLLLPRLMNGEIAV